MLQFPKVKKKQTVNVNQSVDKPIKRHNREKCTKENKKGENVLKPIKLI